MVKSFRIFLKSRRIAVLLGGPSAERTISIKTGKAVLASLKRQGFKAVAIDASARLPEQLKTKRINFAFIALHGTGGEDGQVQGLLEWLKIPYTGSGVLASAVAMDKVASKRLFEFAGLRSAPWRVVTRQDKKIPLPVPFVVKPSAQGSAVGVSIVRKASQWPRALKLALQYGEEALAERFLSGPEITIGVIGRKTLPIIEILPQHGRAFYDFHAKYAPGGSRHILPARISTASARRAREMSLAACRVLGVRGATRVDLIVDKRLGPCLLEVNTIPGMTETSLLPEAARAAGISFDELVVRIAEESCGA